MKLIQLCGSEENISSIVIEESDDLSKLKEVGVAAANAIKKDEYVWNSGVSMGDRKLSNCNSWYLYINSELRFKIVN
jgi:hypothetical protein|tara:strand:+ start:1617 stop:1847 length:231 start_codon:yes stop_codon:yes gene_type:complete